MNFVSRSKTIYKTKIKSKTNWITNNMQEINFSTLKDKALDVDPDLRFMALEDFKKYLSHQNTIHIHGSAYKGLEGFIPILFRLLDDQNTDVQTQAIKSFEPMVKFLSNDKLLSIISQLYVLILNENEKSKHDQFKTFTTSVPNMALRSIFNSVNKDTNSTSSLCRSIIELIIPQLVSNDITIDSIEILIDIIKNLGHFFKKDELDELSVYLINISFQEAGIVSKRSVIGFESIIQYIKNDESLDNKLLFLKDYKGKNIIIKFQLYAIILKSHLNTNLVDDIYTDIHQYLKLDEELDDDFDFDKYLNDNLVCEHSLIVLNELTKSKAFCIKYNQDIIHIIKYFLNYNPMNEDEDMSEEEDGIEFSEDENEDDGSWKSRIKSLTILSTYIKTLPEILDEVHAQIVPLIPIDDKNDLISIEAIKTLANIMNMTTKPIELTFLEHKIVEKLLIPSKVHQLPTILKLIESINKFNRPGLINQTFARFSQLNSSTNSIEYLNFYDNIFEYCENVQDLSPSIITYIANDLITSLDNRSNATMNEAIKFLIKVFNNPSSHMIDESLIQQIIQKIIYKIDNFKIYSSNTVQLSIVCIGELLVNNLCNDELTFKSIFDSFRNCINYEHTIKKSLEVLIQIYQNSSENDLMIPSDFNSFLSQRLNELILINDEQIRNLSLNLLHLLVQHQVDINFLNLIKVLDNPDDNIFLVFEILDSVLDKSDSLQVLNELFPRIVNLINTNKIELNNIIFFKLMGKLSINNDKLFTELLVLNDSFVKSKLLATIAVENNLQAEIDMCESALLNEIQARRSAENSQARSPSLFRIQFLGYVGERIPLNKIDISLLINLLNQENELNATSNDEVFKVSIATSIGCIVKRDIARNLMELIKFYQDPAFHARNYLITSFKILIPEANDEALEIIWRQISSNISSIQFCHNNCGELRNCGDLFSDIILKKRLYVFEIIKSIEKLNEQIQFNEQQDQPKEQKDQLNKQHHVNEDNLSISYTSFVIIKNLLNKFEDSDQELEILTSLINISIQWITIMNIDIKQLLIGNLLTCLHNKPSTILPILNDKILPHIFNQLKQEPQFKKIIPMGPYKYIIDEGLEIRKLCYEFIYTLISLDENILNENRISVENFSFNIIKFGLVDDQNDIIVLSTINLINLINAHGAEFRRVIFENDGELLKAVIVNLKFQLNRKLSIKASSQESESYQERMKSIVKLSRKLDALISEGVGELGGWREFFNGLSVDFNIYFLTSEVWDKYWA